MAKLLRWVGIALAVFVAGMLPWWTIWLIEPRPNRVLLAMAEASAGLRDLTPELALSAVWINGAILAMELPGAGLLAYLASNGRLRVGWLWGVAVGTTSVLAALLEPVFLLLMPEVPGRVRYWPEGPPLVSLLRDIMLWFHLLAVMLLPQVGGVLGAVAAGRRRHPVLR